MKMFVCSAVLAAAAGSAFAGVDGVLDGSYGAPLAVQNAPTGFGDSNMGVVNWANGSELDAAFGYMTATDLHVMLTGNVESNFNKLEIFFDTGIAGQNTLRGDNSGVDFNGLNRMAGLTFDASFQASHWVGFTGDGNNWYANAALLLPGGGGAGNYLGVTGPGGPGTLSGGTNFVNLEITIDNRNTVGVTGGSAAGALTATTGVEFIIPLASLGIGPSTPVDICAFINGSGHDYVSNQVLGSLPGNFGNLGEPSNVNFSQYDGDQFFTVVPAPGAAGLLGLAGLASLRRRRA